MAINSMVMNWIIMTCGMLLLVYLGIRANKIASSDDEAGFLLGGRSFGPFVMAGTIMATGFSGWGFVGAPGVVYEFGFTELLANFFFSLSITAAILFFGNFLRSRAGEIGSLTLPEYIRQRHQVSEKDPLGPVVIFSRYPMPYIRKPGGRFEAATIAARPDPGKLAGSYIGIPVPRLKRGLGIRQIGPSTPLFPCQGRLTGEWKRR